MDGQGHNLTLVENIRWKRASNRQDIVPETFVDLGLVSFVSAETGAVDPDQLLCRHIAMRETALDMSFETVMKPAASALNRRRKAWIELDFKIEAGDSWSNCLWIDVIQLDFPGLFLKSLEVVERYGRLSVLLCFVLFCFWNGCRKMCKVASKDRVSIDYLMA